jgi:hypothetical protein
MHMVRLDIHCSNGPGILGTDATNPLFKKRGDLANEKLFAIFWTPDKMVSQLIHDMFGVPCIHTPHYNMCSNFQKELRRVALPLDES